MDTYQRSSGQEKINIDWSSQETSVFVNPAWPVQDRLDLHELTSRFPVQSHIWIASSGTSAKSLRSVKLIALAKSAFLASAEAVNSHLQSSQHDVWMNALPIFHVGGLSIYARAFLSDAKVISFDSVWNPEKFCEELFFHRVTLASLVPAQVFDLVSKKLKSPQSLRAIVIGGGALASDLYLKALELGWPLLPSFGMTECCSQIATAELSSVLEKNPKMKILSHIQAETDASGKLRIKSPALLTGYAWWQENQSQWVDPKQQGWLGTQDQVILEGHYLRPQGRGPQYIKILGEGVSLFRLQEIFEEIARNEDPENWQSYALVAHPHARKENEIIILHATASLEKMHQIFQAYNNRVLSIEKSDRIFAVKEIPRTDLGKIRYEKLSQDLKKLL